jgi:hypothetical protein
MLASKERHPQEACVSVGDRQLKARTCAESPGRAQGSLGI